MRALLTRALVVSLGLTVLPVSVGQVEVLASPATVSEDVVVPFPEGARAQGAGAADTVVSEAVATPLPFSMLGFELPDGVDELRVRTSVDGQDWGPWTATARIDAEDGPDPDSEEAAHDRSHRFTEPVWVEEGRHLQVELPADQAAPAGELRAALIDSRGLSGGAVERRVVSAPASAEAAGQPRVISRGEWGADESWARSTRAANQVHMGVVHHTATSNAYSDARAVMRSMYRYHTHNLGWADLGYNIVVDQQGNIYEGRAGGLERGIVGAHASGYNTGSFGVSVIGNFDQIHPPQAAVDAVTEVVAWQSRVHDIDPQGWTNAMSNSWQRTIVGHRDVGTSACPGRYFYPKLDEVRDQAAASVDAAPEPAPITPPRTTITSGPSGTTEATTATLAFSATGDVSFYECQWQDGEWYPCASARTFRDLADGDYTFRARAVDPDGNRESPVASRSWTVQTEPITPPRTTITSGPSGTTETTTATLAFSATGDVSFYECQWQDGVWYPCASARTFRDLADGDYTFRARAVDPDGNRESPVASRSWTVQTAWAFSDIAGDVHAETIAAVAEAGISHGYPDGTFRPRDGVRRDHMATFLTRALELPPGDPTRFSDVTEGPHADAIGAVAQAGISEGYPDGTFRPDVEVTREQMATFLTHALDLPAGDGSRFEDIEGSAHADGIAALAEAGISEGFPDGTFRPDEVVTRGQMATFLMRALEYRSAG